VICWCDRQVLDEAISEAFGKLPGLREVGLIMIYGDYEPVLKPLIGILLLFPKGVKFGSGGKLINLAGNDS